MNGVSAAEKYKDFNVTLSRGLTKAGEDQYQILITQKVSDPLYSESQFDKLNKLAAASQKSFASIVREICFGKGAG